MLIDTFDTTVLLILMIALTLAILVIVGVKVWYSFKIIKANAESSKSEYLETMFAHIGDTIRAVVNNTTQTYVAEQKNNGKFDLDQQRCAFKLSQAAVHNLLNAEARSLIAQTHGDVPKWISTQIESAVLEQGLAKFVDKP